MKMILFNQNPMITKLLESVSKKLELSMEDFNRYQELSTRLKEDPEWILIADDECLEKLDQVDWLELKEIISQNKNSVCMYKKGNEAQPFLEGFEMKIKKPFLPTEVLKVLQKKLGSNMSELEPSQNLDPTQEVLETNWDELENLGDLEALVQEEPNNEEQLLPTLNAQEEKEEVKETPQEEKPKDDETQEGETLKDEEISKELETQEELEIPKEETQEQAKEQEPIKEETQENKEEKQEKTQDSPSAQELEAMQELVKEIQENSNGQEDKKETQENTETPQEKETQELEIPQNVETPQDKETQENTETPQELEKQELETQEKTQESAETPQEKTQKLETQEDHYESIEDIPEPVMAQAMGEELPFLNESVAKTSNNENDTETPKKSVIKTPQEKEESDKTSSPLELRLNLQDLLKSLNQESLKSLLENKTLSIKITLEDKKPDA
ncbi:hypothetical protein [Helicobacter pylori]|uniref:hypothetical protein n=1 Tax=Helicobacter pylori TaxID=210 RepID=UPI001C55D042|nr:hypothetical protein [Helicobacter pylori]